MTRPRSLLAVAACLLALAGCGSSHHTASGPATSAASTTPTTTTSPGEHAAASLFAAAYFRLLDGDGFASELPDATASVRALAGWSGSIPAARRRGTLVMTQLHPAAGGYLLTARDEAHAFYAQMALAEQHGRWLVVQLTPPDFVQVFAPVGPPPPVPPPGSAGAANAARLFLRGYLPWLYGNAPLHAITGASRGLLANLKAHPPRVPLTMRSLQPQVAAIAMQRHGDGWQALPNVNDGHETYELVLTVAQIHGTWLVSNVSSKTR